LLPPEGPLGVAGFDGDVPGVAGRVVSAGALRTASAGAVLRDGFVCDGELPSAPSPGDVASPLDEPARVPAAPVERSGGIAVPPGRGC